jgi:guanylate kinase
MKGKLVIFSAPSGSGKTTIVRHLLEQNLNLEFSISAASRAKRDTETHGVDYYFISVDEFREKIDNNEFLEWEEVYPDHYYGTLKSEVERIRNKGNHVIFDIDVVGGVNIKEEFGKDSLAIFIKPPSKEELEKRLRSRNTDSDNKIKRRLEKADFELSFADKFDVVVVNDKLELAIREAEQALSDFLM